MNKIALTSVALVLVTACGSDSSGPSSESSEPSGSPDAPRVVEVAMTDMAFEPAVLDVSAGETITFVFRNDGAVRHEAVVGDMSEQEEHHAEMAEASGEHGMESMDHGDDMPAEMPAEMPDGMHGVVVEPGESLELTHTFGASGPMVIGCHEPGHWEAGMRLDVAVT